MTKPSFGTQVTVITTIPKGIGTSAVSVYAPKYIGRSINVHPISYQEGDWWTVCSTAGSAIAAGVYYYDNGVSSSPTVITTSSSSVLQGKLVSALGDIAWAEDHGYQTATTYGGFDVFFQAMGSVRAYIDELFANTIMARNSITVATGGTILSQNFATGVSGFRAVGETGDAEFNNVAVRGQVTATSGSIGSFIIGTYLNTGNKSTYNDDVAGVHVGSDGIGLGSNFKVSAAGALAATSAVLSGSLASGGVLSASKVRIDNDGITSFTSSYSLPATNDYKTEIRTVDVGAGFNGYKCLSTGSWTWLGDLFYTYNNLYSTGQLNARISDGNKIELSSSKFYSSVPIRSKYQTEIGFTSSAPSISGDSAMAVKDSTATFSYIRFYDPGRGWIGPASLGFTTGW